MIVFKEGNGMYKKVLFLMSIVFVLSIVATSAADFIGGLRNVKGTGLVIRDQEEIAAKDGLRIHKGDRLKTGKDGAMGVIFSDNTRVSIGPDSEISIDDYVFYPDKGALSFMIKMAKGTASYFSGSIARLARQSVKFQTPTAIVGIRGTHFLVKVEGEK